MAQCFTFIMNGSPYFEIKTTRLLLRKLKHSDYEALIFLRSDEAVNKFVHRPRTETQEQAIKFINTINENIDLDRSYYWVISLLDYDVMIGSICLWNISEDRKIAEVGYDLHPDHQGKGIMSEALKAVLDFGFNTLRLDQIEACTHRDNEASRRLLQRGGFRWVEERVDEDVEYNVIYVLGNNEVN